MRKSLHTFAATLAAAGLLTVGAVTVAQDETPPQPPQPHSQSTADETAEDVADSATEEVDTAEDSAEAVSSETENRSASADESTSDSEATKATQEATEHGEATADSADKETTDAKLNQDSSQKKIDDKKPAEEWDSATPADRQSESDENAKDMNEASLDTPPVPDQARDATANSRAARDADWRMVGYNNQWWYYSPQGQWFLRDGNQWRPFNSAISRSVLNRAESQRLAHEQGREPYSTSYRKAPDTASMESQSAPESQSVAQLHYDRCGRPFICENGRRVYVQVDRGTTSATGQRTMSTGSESAQPTIKTRSEATYRGEARGESDNLGRPTPARDELRSTPPAPPTAE